MQLNRLRTTGVVATLGLALAGAAATQAAAPDRDAVREPQVAGSVTAILAGRLIDPAVGRVLTDQVILIRAGRIVALGAKSETPVPAGAKLIDLSRETVLPGLIDVHVHITHNPADEGLQGLTVSVAREAINGVANAGATLRAGFTSVRNLDAGGYSDVALRNAINEHLVEGPRMQVSGPALGASGGHADIDALPQERYAAPAGVADGPWALRAKVRSNIRNGVDVIKIMETAGLLSRGPGVGGMQISEEEMAAIVAEAHLHGLKVAVHAHGAEGIKAALRAGADSIEHATLIDDEGLRMAKERGAYLDMDIYKIEYLLAHGGPPSLKPVGETQRQNFAKAVQKQEKMAFATDASVFPNGENARQFAVMVASGMTPMQAVVSATTAAADLMGWSDRVGRIAPGFYADIVAVRQDPIADIKALEHLDFVMKNGEVVRQDQTTR